MGTILLLFAFNNNANNKIFSSVPAAVQRRFARNAAHVAVRDALQALRGPAALIRNSTAQARIHMTRGWAVESGGSTSCEWKEGGNAACSALVNCPTDHEAAKWDSPHCPRQWRRYPVMYSAAFLGRRANLFSNGVNIEDFHKKNEKSADSPHPMVWRKCLYHAFFSPHHNS